MSLFATPNQKTHLVEFNAGKCIIEGPWIKPDTRKGLLYMDQGEDHLLHLYWKERKPQSTPEDNMIIFPDEAEFIKVSQCTTGRVYLLKFKTSSEMHFYWMQSKEEENDQELVERVNELIRDPEANMNASSELDGFASLPEWMRLVRGVDGQDPNMTPENLLQFLNSMNGSADTQDDEDDEDDPVEEANTPPGNAVPAPVETPTVTATPSAPVSEAPRATAAPTEANESAPSTTSSNQPSAEQLDQLRQMLANIQPAENSAPIALNDVLTSQSLAPLLNDSEFCASLFPFLPENSERSPEEVRQVVLSPQFRQALQSLGAALQTGQLGPLLTQLGLDASAGDSVESFLMAINEQAKDKKKEENAMDED